MSGHSKWNNIKRKKEATDGQRAKIFTKIAREIAVAVKEGGSDVNNNSRLRDLVSKARDNNVPNDNIERCIKKAAGEGDRNSYEEITYEGYGPSGVAVIVETLTDNRNRTAGDLRHYFDKYGGNLGQSGCVSYLFTEKGVLVAENTGLDEEKVMEDCFDAGALDFSMEEDMVEIDTDPLEVGKVRQALEEKGYHILSGEAMKIPSTYVVIEDEDTRAKMEKLLDMLEDNDDVQNVWHNWQNDDEDE